MLRHQWLMQTLITPYWYPGRMLFVCSPFVQAGVCSITQLSRIMSVKRTRRSACDDLDDMHKRLKALNARLSQTRADYDAQINALFVVFQSNKFTLRIGKAQLQHTIFENG